MQHATLVLQYDLKLPYRPEGLRHHVGLEQ